MAGPLSPPDVPPARMEIVPPLTMRTVCVPVSAMSKLPEASTLTESGWFRLALKAEPPLPQPVLGSKHAVRLPATVVMSCAVVLSTLRMDMLPLSAMNKLPLASMKTPAGALNPACVAGPPSPPLVLAVAGLPA